MSFHPEDEQLVQSLCLTTRKSGVPVLCGGAKSFGRRDDSPVDTQGARALAARIAAGPPGEKGTPQDETHGKFQEPRPSVPSPGRVTSRSESAVQIVYLKTERAPRREVRIYVRGPEDTLERQL
jgi:hypothetical protein